MDKPSASDVRAVGYIAMELMQKYAKEDGAIGIDNLNRWPADSEAVKFLSMTTSAGSVEELKKVSKVASRKLWLTSLARVIQASMAQRGSGVAGGVDLYSTQGIQILVVNESPP